MASVVAQQPRQQLPDYTLTGADWFGELNRIVGGLARAGLALIFSGLALAVLIFLLVKVIGG